MMRGIAKILALGLLLVGGTAGVVLYHGYFSTDRQVRKLEEEKRQLQQIVQRLTDERRVAEVLVTDQKTVDGVLQTTLLFVEYSRDGSSTLPPKRFTIRGNIAHIDALVVKFDNDLVAKNDPLRGHSIALFTRIYGEYDQPGQAATIDTPGKVPDFYRGTDPAVSEFEQELWQNFWKLAEDEAYRQSKGVRVANGQGVWGPFNPDRLYTLTIESNGGVNITSEPLKGIYREALKHSAADVR